MFFISFLPIIIYIVVLKLLDSFKLVKWKFLVLCLLSGTLTCAVAFFFSDTTNDMGIQYCAPLVEEGLKALAAVLLMRVFRIVFFAEALCYGAAIGGGFALLENILYLAYSPMMLPATAIFRGLCTAMLHIGCTALFLTLFLQRRYNVVTNGDAGRRWYDRRAVRLLIAIVPSIVIHQLYNIQALPPFILMLVVVAVFFIIFLFINAYNERRIYRWLDSTIVSDVDLLTAIRNGTLSDTNAGRYLQSVKGQFEPEVFFDMLCYIQLYLELTISAKSRIMLKEAGLPVKEMADDKAKRTGMIREFKVLRSNIGVIGEMVLHPIVRLSMEDLKIIEG